MPTGNIIITWNNIYLDLVRRVGGAPGPLARIGGLMHLAMFEAVNLLTATPPRYATSIAGIPMPNPSPGTSQVVATAASAASYVLEKLIPEYVESLLAMQGEVPNPFDPFQVMPNAKQVANLLPAELARSTTATNDNMGLAPTVGQDLGQIIAQAVLDANPVGTGLDPTVTPPLDPTHSGEWRETGSGPALTPRWGEVSFALLDNDTKDEYFPSAIPNVPVPDYASLLASAQYAAALQEVRQKGAASKSTRVNDETATAFFWANDLNGTYKPPGQFYSITQMVAKNQGTLDDQPASATDGLLETARLFAMVGTAMFNASIVAWQAKYFWPEGLGPYIRLWRPETAIQQMVANPDPGWQPLSAMTTGLRFSPNFPAYVSGHSTFGAAWAAAMGNFYGKDGIDFVATTEDPHAAKDDDGVRITRPFTHFTAAARQNGYSRVLLGVHYQFDVDGGYDIGMAVGQATAQKFT